MRGAMQNMQKDTEVYKENSEICKRICTSKDFIFESNPILLLKLTASDLYVHYRFSELE